MRTLIKYLPYFVILVLITIVLQQCDRAERAEKAVVGTTKSAKIWRDKYRRSNAEISVLQLDSKTFREYHHRIVDSLKRAGIKLKTVEKIVTLTSTTSGTVTLTNNMFSDRWMSFKLDGSSLTFKQTDSLALITYHNKYGFLNMRSKYVTRAISFNPYTTLTGITSSEIVPKVPRLTFGVNVGYGLNLSDGIVRPGWHAGIGLQVRLW